MNTGNATPAPADVIRHLPEDARSRLQAGGAAVVTAVRRVTTAAPTPATWDVEQRVARLVDDVPIPWQHG